MTSPAMVAPAAVAAAAVCFVGSKPSGGAGGNGYNGGTAAQLEQNGQDVSRGRSRLAAVVVAAMVVRPLTSCSLARLPSQACFSAPVAVMAAMVAAAPAK